MKNLTVLFLATSLLAACGGSGGGSGSGGGGPQALALPSHNSAECPIMNGDYTRDGGNSRKTIKSKMTSAGFIFEDTEVGLVIDGARHELSGESNPSYVGSCSNHSVILNFFRDGKALGQITYSWNEKGQLVIETKSLDANEQSGTEIWDAQK